MTCYTNIKVRISEGQKDELKKAFESNCKSTTIRLRSSDLHGDDFIVITNSKLDRLVKAYEEKRGMTIKMSKTQLSYNMKIFTGVSRIDSIPNGICFTCTRSWGFIRTGEHGSTKTNWK